MAERRTAYAALLETIRLFREGLLVQSRATADSTLAQYRVGKVTFASVLEANAGYINDEESFLAAVADAQRIAIAAAEVSLEQVGGAERAARWAGAPSRARAPRAAGAAAMARRGLGARAADASSSGSMTSGM